MKTSVLSVDDPAWNRQLSDIPHDFYHLAEYHRFESLNCESTAQMFVAVLGEQKFAWPYLLRRAQVPGCEDVSGAFEVRAGYGYPGPAQSAGATDEFLAEALEQLTDTWRRAGVVSAFAPFHPTLETARPWLRLQEAGALDRFQTMGNTAVRVLGPTVSIDLRQNFEERRSGYDKKESRRIRKNERDGMVTCHDAEFTALPLFCDFYRAAMRRVNAETSYYFDRSYFERLIRWNPGVVHLFVTKQPVSGQADAVACAGLISEYAGQLQALFIMSNPEFLRSSPSKNNIDAICDWGSARGARNFHLGGGKGARRDGLFDFKCSFSPLRHDYCQMRLIIDPAEYRRLLKIREALNAASVDATFFPLWRSPLVEESPAHGHAPLEV